MALEFFTIEEFRALPQMGDTAKYPPDRVESAAGFVVATTEGSAGVSFIPRSHTVVKSGTEANARGGAITLMKRRPIAVTAVSQSGVALSPTELAQLSINRGVLRWLASGVAQPWETGIDNVSITYTAGFSSIPADVKEATLQATRARVLALASNASIDDRRTSINTDHGTITYVIAGEGRPTGYPEVDEVLMRYRRSQAPLVMT